MKRVTDIDGSFTCKKFKTALSRFMKKYPGHDEWIETLEWMYENGVHFLCDNMDGDGNYNQEWSWAVHLDIPDEDCYYIALIERA